jgi:hypothetical protein
MDQIKVLKAGESLRISFVSDWYNGAELYIRRLNNGQFFYVYPFNNGAVRGMCSNPETIFCVL